MKHTIDVLDAVFFVGSVTAVVDVVAPELCGNAGVVRFTFEVCRGFAETCDRNSEENILRIPRSRTISGDVQRSLTSQQEEMRCCDVNALAP